MASTTKTPYPKALPLHSPDELAAQASRLNQQSEELTAKSERLEQRSEALANKAATLRVWTWRLVGGYALLVLLGAGAVGIVVKFPNLVTSSIAAPPDVAQADPPLPTPAPPKLDVVSPSAPKQAPMVAPIKEVAPPKEAAPVDVKPNAAASLQKAGFLEALGGLSATHLYQSHLNIGLLADAVESETYTVEEAEKNLKSVVDLMKMVDAQLARLSKSGLDPEDQESLKQIQTVNALLNLQVETLRAYWATDDEEQAAQYHKARKASWQGLSKVMGFEP